MLQLDPDIERYILENSSPEDELLTAITRSTYLKTPYPQMMSGHLLGLLLEFIVQIKAPAAILEIGTFTGYGTIRLARKLPADGKVITLEKDDEQIPGIRENLKAAGLSNRVTLIHGNALKVIPEIPGTFDMVFIDGNKPEYPDYYKLVREKLNKGAVIIADNTLWGGKVSLPQHKMDAATKGIHQFNKLVLRDQEVSVVILPIRDGISLIHYQE